MSVRHHDIVKRKSQEGSQADNQFCHSDIISEYSLNKSSRDNLKSLKARRASLMLIGKPANNYYRKTRKNTQPQHRTFLR